MAVICRQGFFAFCRAEIFYYKMHGEIIIVIYTIIKERRLIMLVATIRGLFATIILPTRYARK